MRPQGVDDRQLFQEVHRFSSVGAIAPGPSGELAPFQIVTVSRITHQTNSKTYLRPLSARAK